MKRSKTKRSEKAEDQRSRNDQLLKKIKDQLRSKINGDQKIKDQRSAEVKLPRIKDHRRSKNQMPGCRKCAEIMSTISGTWL